MYRNKNKEFESKNNFFTLLKSVKISKSMRNRILIVLTLSALLIVSFTIFRDKKSDKNQVVLEAITHSLNSAHYQPQKLDDVFSEKVYNLYLERIDYFKRFFTQPDIDEFETYKKNLDEQISHLSFDFYSLVNKKFDTYLSRSQRYFTEILSQPFNFELEENYESDPEKRTWSKDTFELKENWRKLLKYETLIRLATEIELQEDAKQKNDTSVKQKDQITLEVEARNKTLKNYQDWYKRMLKLDGDDRFSLFVNSITNVYDPHTEFLPPADKENFDITMTGKLEGIGATLQENNGYIKVVKIVPGSASWKQGELQVNDLILKVAQAKDEPVDIVDMRLDEAVKLIRGKKGTEVKLTVKKPDGTIKVISIIRDIVILEETFAKSAILKSEKNKKNFGYILLPKFYADFEDRNGRNCAEDVEKEIRKLSAENIDGIVLDVRSNGGGSLQEVVKLAGFFIKNGPIVQAKTRLGEASVLRDEDSNIQYSGPLVILVNSVSASASEILAAAMQDYKRAVIIGTNTYGKGTVQRFIDLDDYYGKEYTGMKPLGSIKITIQKFYRINGGATQLKGVAPDIIIPDEYDYMGIGEKEDKFALPWTTIPQVRYDVAQSKNDFGIAIKKAKERIASNSTFKLFQERTDYLKSQKDKTKITLNLKKYRDSEKDRKEIVKKYEKIDKLENKLLISALRDEIVTTKTDTILARRIKEWHKEIQKDFELEEAVNVLNDLK